MKKFIRSPLTVSVSIGIFSGLAVSSLRSEERPEWAAALFSDGDAPTLLEPVRVLPRTEMSLLALEARRAMDAGRGWEAWKILEGKIHEPGMAPAHLLLAARAAASWGAWDQVREVLDGRDWLERAEGGEGLYLLARAHDELGRRQEAAAEYSRYVTLDSPRHAGAAFARLGSALRDGGEAAASARAFARAAQHAPAIADWLRTLEIEQLAAAGDPRAAALASENAPTAAPVRLRRVLAEASARLASGDVEGSLLRLEREARVLRAQRAWEEAARLQLRRGALLAEGGRMEEARALLRAAAAQPAALASTRAEAADALGQIDGRTGEDELARADAYEAAGKRGRAAAALRAALASGVSDAGSLQLRLGHVLYTGRDFAAARPVFEKAAEALSGPEAVAEARLYAARSLYRSSSRSRSAALAEMKRVAERYPNTAAAGTALFLLGDAASTRAAGLAYYRRAAKIVASPDAREALYRVGDRSLKSKDVAAAIAAWEEYVERYPKGEETVRTAYETGRLHEKAGREARARAMYQAALAADPVSYYAFRAGSRLGVHPVDDILASPRPWLGLASDPGDGQAVLERLDALQEAGLEEEWQQELASALRVLDGRPAALLVVAEGLRDRGHPVEAIRLGRALLQKRGGEWDPRLLRVVFPFPYRDLIEAEARRVKLDPMLLAALIRQESSFRHDARSWVGATGLSQIMPSTGRYLASAIGVDGFEPRLLTVPEVNIRMGARYLRDQLASFGGARDLALAAYNAGPGRASRWKRTLDYGRDTDAFRESIPFDETRGYVKVVIRNAALYSRLYAEERPVGLVSPD